MSKPKVFVTQSDMPEPVLDILREVCEVDHWHKTTISKEELLEKVQGIDALFWCSVGKVDKEVLERAGKSLKVIATVSTGYDHIDVKEAKARGIRVGNSPNIGANTVAELTIGLLLATSHRILEVSASLRRGEWGLWCPTWMSGQDIHGSVVGIVGLGAIGQAVAKRLKAFDVSKILYCGRGRKQEGDELGAEFVTFDTLLRESDFVIATTALTAETKGMFNEEAFSKMKKSAIFINTCRGGVVDQDALVNALCSGTIRAAGLDVMTPEPLPPDSPLLQLDNCVLTPHVGTATLRTRIGMTTLAARNIVACLQGKPMPAELL